MQIKAFHSILIHFLCMINFNIILGEKLRIAKMEKYKAAY